jgi:hypothetical protein
VGIVISIAFILIGLAALVWLLLDVKNAERARELQRQGIEDAAETAKRHVAYEARRGEEAMRQAAYRGWPR